MEKSESFFSKVHAPPSFFWKALSKILLNLKSIDALQPFSKSGVFKHLQKAHMDMPLLQIESVFRASQSKVFFNNTTKKSYPKCTQIYVWKLTAELQKQHDLMLHDLHQQEEALQQWFSAGGGGKELQ